MADLFLVFCTYTLMLGAGPCAAWAVARRAAREDQRKRCALEARLADDPTCLLDAQREEALSFLVVEAGLDLHIGESHSQSGGARLCAHAHGLVLGRQTDFSLSFGDVARRPSPRPLGQACQRIFGPRIVVRARDEGVLLALLQDQEVREALLDAFRAPLHRSALRLDADGTLSLWVERAYDPEVVTALRARTLRLVQVLHAHTRRPALS